MVQGLPQRRRILLDALRMGRFFALLALTLCAAGAFAQQDQASWHLLIEPQFMHPEVSMPISGAKSTALVAGYVDADGMPQYFSKKDWDAQKLNWDTFRVRAAQNATEKKFHAELVRDSHKVVQYAAITSEDPLAATMILSPDFLKKFKDIFGPSVLVAVPDRYTVFVFPELASDYQNYAPMILREYHDSDYPVSLEVFEISSAGIKAIGAFEDN
jgi:hypothetical protein